MTTALLDRLIPRAVAKRIPILVDPYPEVDWSKYRGATLIKANRRESLFACPDKPDDARRCVKLTRRFNATMVITLLAPGMVVAKGNEASQIPAYPRRVRDTCGAGDAVLALLADSMPTETLRQVCQRAAAMAADQVSTLGVTRLAV